MRPRELTHPEYVELTRAVEKAVRDGGAPFERAKLSTQRLKALFDEDFPVALANARAERDANPLANVDLT